MKLISRRKFIGVLTGVAGVSALGLRVKPMGSGLEPTDFGPSSALSAFAAHERWRNYYRPAAKTIDFRGAANFNDELLAEVPMRAWWEVKRVYFGFGEISPRGYFHLKKARHTEVLSLPLRTEKQFSLKYLKDLSRLKALSFERADFGESRGELAITAKLKHLESLSFERSNLTDLGLSHLRDTGQIKTLNLAHSGITGLGLRYISGFSKLRKLDISYNQISGRDLEALSELQSIECLNLLGAREISSAQLSALGKLTKLKLLLLPGENLDDEALKVLSAYKGLEKLRIVRGSFGLTAVEQLRSSLINTSISI